MDQVNVDNYVVSASQAGITKDQIRRFVSTGYIALSVALPFHAAARQIDSRNGITQILLDGTRGSAKSHAIVAQVGLDDCQLYPGLKWLFLRKTLKAAGESFDDLVYRVLRGVKHTQNSEKVEFPNGSKIVIGGYDTDKDIEKYIGIEYDGIVIEEATQIKGEQHDKLAGSLRTSKPDWVPRMYLSTNPGGIGHEYIKDKFITNPRSNTLRFFSRYTDNPFINPEYKVYLENLEGDLAKAWRDGDWNILAGQYFSRFRDFIHGIEPIPIDQYWGKLISIDWGYNPHPYHVGWYAQAHDGTVYKYREAQGNDTSPEDLASLILTLSKEDKGIRSAVGDTQMWEINPYQAGSGARQGVMYSDKSIADTLQRILKQANITLYQANKARITGWTLLRTMMEWDAEFDQNNVRVFKKKPQYYIFKTCVKTLTTYPNMIHDDLKPEDMEKMDGDDPCDTDRYALMHIKGGKIPKPPDTTYDKLLREVTQSNSGKDMPA